MIESESQLRLEAFKINVTAAWALGTWAVSHQDSSERVCVPQS